MTRSTTITGCSRLPSSHIWPTRHPAGRRGSEVSMPSSFPLLCPFSQLFISPCLANTKCTGPTQGAMIGTLARIARCILASGIFRSAIPPSDRAGCYPLIVITTKQLHSSTITGLVRLAIWQKFFAELQRRQARFTSIVKSRITLSGEFCVIAISN